MSTKLFCQQMHLLLKHKMLQFIFKISFLIWLLHVSVPSDHHHGAYDGTLPQLVSLKSLDKIRRFHRRARGTPRTTSNTISLPCRFAHVGNKLVPDCATSVYEYSSPDNSARCSVIGKAGTVHECLLAGKALWSREKLLVSHRAPPQVADRAMHARYGGYRENEITGVDQN